MRDLQIIVKACTIPPPTLNLDTVSIVGGTWNNGRWYGGTWNKGYWYNGTWNDGTWNNGRFIGGIWVDGTWNSGIFNTDNEPAYWIDGDWYGGDFENGMWYNGYWEQKNGLSRFGTKSLAKRRSKRSVHNVTSCMAKGLKLVPISLAMAAMTSRSCCPTSSTPAWSLVPAIARTLWSLQGGEF